MRDFGISLPGGEGDEDPFYKSKQEAFSQDVMPSYKETPAPKFDGYSNLSYSRSIFGVGGGVEPSKPKEKVYDAYAYLDRVSVNPTKADESGDTSRGFSAALNTTPALLKGAVGYAGAVGEQTFGEGGLFSGLKKWGLEGYEKGMEEIQSKAKDTDDVTKAWEKAKQGDLGALVDWAQYGIGYVGGNILETAATAVLGGAVGAVASGPAAPAGAVGGAVTGAVSKGVVKGFIESLVTKEAAKLAAGKEVTEEIAKQATKNVAKRAGSATALVGSGIAKETGSIYGEAEEQAQKEGRELDAGDLSRIFVAGTAAGFTDAAVNMLGLGAIAGKIRIPGGGRAGRAFVGAVSGVGIEGGTEVMQSVIERYGAAKALTGEEAMNEYINAFALGALGGGTIGGLSGALRSGKQDPDTIQKLYEKAQQELTSPDGMAQLYQQMAADPKVGPILEANNITSAEDPRFAQVVARTIKLEQLDAELNMTGEQRKQLRKERAADVKAAFGETASTGVGVGMGTPTEGVIQRASVVPDEQTKTLVPVGEKAEPVTLTSPDGQSTQAVSGEDMVAAQQGFSPVGGFTVPNPTNQQAPFVFANRFGSPTDAADLAANLQALSQMEQQLAAGISNKRKLGKVRSQYNDLLAGVMGFQRVVKWAGWKPFLPDMTGVQIQVRQGKRAASEGGGVFFFLESRPLEAVKPKQATQPPPAPAAPPVAPPSASQAPSQPPVTPAPAAPAAPTPAPAAPATDGGTTEEKPAPKKKAEKPAAKKAKETSKKKEAKAKPEPKPAPKKEPPAAKKAKETSKKTKAEKEGPAFLTPEENEELKALLQKAVAAEEEKQNAAQEGKQPEGDQQQRPGNDAGRKERGRKDRERQAQEPEARPEDRGGDSTPQGETVAEQLKRLARERKAALTQEGKEKVDAVEQAFAKMMSWVNRVEEARIEGGGVVDPTDTSRPNLAKATREFVDAVSAIFGDSNVPSVFVAMVRDERDLPSIYTEFEATGKVEGADPNFPARMAYSETTLGIPATQLKDLERQVAELAEVNKIAKNEKAVQIYRDAIQRSVTKKLEKLVGKDSVQAVFDQIRSRVTFLKEATDWVQRSLERMARASLSPAEREQSKSPLDKTDKRLINREEIAEEWDGRRESKFGQPTDEDAPTWDRLKREEPVLALRFAQLVMARQPKSGFEEIVAAYKRNRRAENAKEQLRAGRDEATRREAEVNKAARITKKLKSRDILTKEDKAALGERFGDGYLDSFVDELLKYQTSPSKAPKWLQPALKRALDYLADGNIPAEKADVQDWNKGIPPGAVRLFNKRLSDLAQRGASLTEVLQLIARSSPNNRSRQVAGLLLRNGNPDATIAIINEEQALIAREAYARQGGNPNDLAAYYDDTQQAINLLTPDNIEYFVLHEGTHAGTIRAIELGTPAGKELVALFEANKEKLGDQYGGKNAKEFIAEALSSQAFKRKLESIPSSEPKTYKNLWEQIKAILRRIFGFGETAEQKSLFDRVLELAPRVMQENAALMNPMSFEELTAAALKVEGPFKESDYRKPVVDWAKARFGDRKAPDGTIVWQNFVAWFGDSKAVNDKGEPQVWYHGTARDITVFRAKQAGAIFVTTEPGFAESFTDSSVRYMRNELWDMTPPAQRFAWMREATEIAFQKKEITASQRKELLDHFEMEEKGKLSYRLAFVDAMIEERIWGIVDANLPSNENIIPLFVRAENPFDFANKDQATRLINAVFNGNLIVAMLRGGEKVELTRPNGNKVTYSRKDFEEAIEYGSWNAIESPEVQAILRGFGHDSFYVTEGGEKNLAVYDPSALKAVYNRGQFGSGPMIDAATNQSAAAAVGDTVNSISTGRRSFIKSMIGMAVGISLPQSRAFASNFNSSVRNGNLQGALSAIETGSANPAFRTLAKKLKGLTNNTMSLTLVEPGRVYPRGVPASLSFGAAGVARVNRKDGGIDIFLRSDVGADEGTLLHETIHAALLARYDLLNVYLANKTLRSKNADPALKLYERVYDEFRSHVNRHYKRYKGTALVEDLRGSLPLGVQAAYQNPDEFITYALTDPETQAWMQSRKYDGKSLWGRFKEFVASTLGFGGTEPSWLDAALRVGNEVLDQAAKDAPDYSTSKAVLKKSGVAEGSAMAVAPGWEINEGGRKDNWLYLFVDKQIDLKRVQQGLAQAGRDIADKWNAYLKEELFHGRSAKRIKDFLEVEVNPVLRMMAANRVDIAELDDYLHARHAKEANEQVARVNPQMPDGGSGMKTADAQQYLNSIPAQRRAVLESIAKRVDAMTKGTRELMVEYGLESRDTINKFEAAYKSYVPLFRENTEGGSLGAGQGYSIRGSETRRRTGSNRKVVDVFANIAMQRERVITRGEKNRVGNALYGMVAMNPNKEFWQAINPNADDPKKLEAELISMGINPADASEIVKQPLRKVIDKRSGMVVSRVNPALASMPNVLVTRVNGEDRMIIFNAADQRAVRLAGSMKSLDANQLGQALSSMGEAGNLLRNAQSFVGGATRYFAAIQTQYNPAFGLYNFLRDLGGASLNLSSTPLRGMEKQIIAESITAGMNIWRDLRLLRNGQKAQTMWGKLFEEFDLEGGKTGFRDMFYDPGTKTKNLQTEIEIMRGDKPWPAARAKARFFADALSDFNESIENAIRLATYKAAKEKGLTNEQAASVAKNITVNFNRKGAASNGFSMLYAFFNASVQGSARLAETLRGPAGKKIIQGSIALGIAQAFVLAASGFEEDEPPDFVKDKNLVIPIWDGKYLAIPLPLGFNVLPALSRRMVELLTSDNPNYGKAFVGMAQTVIDGFNPLGSATFAQTISPTITDPVIALAENKDFTGKPISREDMNPLDPTPGFTRGKQNATGVATALAELINRLSGGTDATKGALSPTPDQLEYLVGQATGGVGREAMKIIKVGEAMIADEELATYNIPVIGRLGGNLAQRAIQTSRFYENVKRMNEHQREYESLVKKGESEGYMEKYPEAQLYRLSDSVYRQISELKRTRKAMAESGEYSKQDLKEIDEVILFRMSEFNLQVKEARARR